MYTWERSGGQLHFLLARISLILFEILLSFLSSQTNDEEIQIHTAMCTYIERSTHSQPNRGVQRRQEVSRLLQNHRIQSTVPYLSLPSSPSIRVWLHHIPMGVYVHSERVCVTKERLVHRPVAWKSLERSAVICSPYIWYLYTLPIP